MSDIQGVAAVRAKPLRWPVVVAATTVVSLLAGSALAVSAMVLLGWRPRPERDYIVSVFLKPEVTAAQKAAVEEAMARIPEAGAVRFTDKETALARMKELFKDRPEFTRTLTRGAAPESFEVTVTTREISCDGISGLWGLAGVRDVGVADRATPGVKIVCY